MFSSNEYKLRDKKIIPDYERAYIFQYIEHQQLNESIFQTAVYFLTLMVKFVTSRQFSCFSIEKSKLPSSVQELLNSKINPTSAIFSVFTDSADIVER